MAWRQIINNTRQVTIIASQSNSSSTLAGFFRFYSKSPRYTVKVGIPEFLNGIGKGVETHAAKLESEIGDFQKLIVTRSLKLKKIGIPCQHRKQILNYAHKFRVGLWRPRADLIKAK